jgi:hypothetical protein
VIHYVAIATIVGTAWLVRVMVNLAGQTWSALRKPHVGRHRRIEDAKSTAAYRDLARHFAAGGAPIAVPHLDATVLWSGPAGRGRAGILLQRANGRTKLVTRRMPPWHPAQHARDARGRFIGGKP